MLSGNMIGRVLQFHIDVGAPETFVVGQLVWMNKQWFLVRCISASGKWDGLALYLLSDIVAVHTDGEYIRKITYLLHYRKDPLPSIPEIGAHALADFFKFAKETHKMVGLELYMSGCRDAIGFIISFDNHMLCIQQVDEYGKPDGISFIDDDAITRCFIDDEDLLCLKLLNQQYSFAPQTYKENNFIDMTM